MKKLGIIIFVVALLIGVVFSNLFSFGKASASFIKFSFNSVVGSGVAASEARNLRGFKGVDVGGVFQVEVTAGKEFNVVVEADDNLLQYVKTEVSGDVLKITSTERLKSSTPMRIRISAPDIESIDASGACKVSVNDLKSSELRVDTSGASKVNIAGEASSLTIDVSGASNIDAANLKAENATVDASGASKVEVFVTGRLVSEASGASKIGYAGNPTSVTKESSGAGKVYQK
ncbi:MAG TPA: head GIN domain-containing protein [Pyrinomonadaceae bacterium]|nr:head GIN domain-containing protein [Pyrinomonadaceae bacterium]